MVLALFLSLYSLLTYAFLCVMILTRSAALIFLSFLLLHDFFDTDSIYVLPEFITRFRRQKKTNTR